MSVTTGWAAARPDRGVAVGSQQVRQPRRSRWAPRAVNDVLGAGIVGDGVQAQELLRRSLDVHRGFVVGWDIARILTCLGNAALALEEIEEARQCYQEAQQWAGAEEAGSLPSALAGLARVEAKAGRPQQALGVLF